MATATSEKALNWRRRRQDKHKRLSGSGVVVWFPWLYNNILTYGSVLTQTRPRKKSEDVTEEGD